MPEVRRDGSDQPVRMPGEAFLLLVLHPAQAHGADGTPTVSGTHRTGMAGIKAYAVVGDYEGYVSTALGLSGVHGYHVATLTTASTSTSPSDSARHAGRPGGAGRAGQAPGPAHSWMRMPRMSLTAGAGPRQVDGS